MGAGEVDSSHGDEGGAGTIPRSSGGSPRGAAGHETHKLTYQVILRHLAKFRDGAKAILEFLDTHAPEHAEPTAAATVTAERRSRSQRWSCASSDTWPVWTGHSCRSRTSIRIAGRRPSFPRKSGIRS